MENLRAAVSTNDHLQLQTLVQEATLTAKDMALGYAVLLRREAMVRILLEHGAYENAYVKESSTPYPYITTFVGRKFITEEILRERDNDDLVNSYEHDPIKRVLHLAYENRDMRIIGLLLDHGASLQIRYLHNDFDDVVEADEDDYYEGYELQDAQYARTLIDHAIIGNYKEMLLVFQAHGWNVNDHIAHRNETPLMVACRINNNDMISFLCKDLKANADIQSEMKSNVQVCIRNGNRQGLQILMDAHVDMDMPLEGDLQLSNWRFGITSTVECAIWRYMIEIGGDSSIPLYDPNDPNDEDNQDIVNRRRGIIKDNQDDIVKRRRGIIKDILEYTVDFDFTIFDLSHFEGEEGIMPIPDNEFSPDDELDEHASRQDTIHRIAQMNGAPSAIKDLVNQYRRRQAVYYNDPYNIDFQDQFGRTALHRAIKNGDLHAVQYLIMYKYARQDIRDMWGNTAYDALKKDYSDKLLKVEHPEMFGTPYKDYNYGRNDEVTYIRSNIEHEGLTIHKLSNFRAIGRWLARRNLFVNRLGPQIKPIGILSRMIGNFL